MSVSDVRFRRAWKSREGLILKELGREGRVEGRGSCVSGLSKSGKWARDLDPVSETQGEAGR